MSASSSNPTLASRLDLLTTFTVGDDLFGIEVMKVQEVTGNPKIIPIPLAPVFIRGLINLRGQLATALGLHELFTSEATKPGEQMSVVCKMEGNLVSLLVDSIGDVIEVRSDTFANPPDSLPGKIRPYIKGIYKLENRLLSLLDLERISLELSPSIEQNN